MGRYDLGMHNQNLLLKAKDLGLDTLVMGIRDAGKLRELLSIGEDQDVAAVIAPWIWRGRPSDAKALYGPGNCQILLISAEVRHGEDYESIHSRMGALGVLYGDFFAMTLGAGAGDIPGRQGPGGTLPGIPRYIVTEEDGNSRSVREMKRTPEDRPSFSYLP